MFRLYASGHKLCSLASHLRQELLSFLVDKGDVTQVHNRVCIARSAAAMIPTRTQLSYPRTCQLSAQRPPLSCFCLTVHDPQHGDSVLAVEKSIRRAN